VGWVSPVPAQMWERVWPVPAQMLAGVSLVSAKTLEDEPSPACRCGKVERGPKAVYEGCARSRRRCGRGAQTQHLCIREVSFADFAPVGLFGRAQRQPEDGPCTPSQSRCGRGEPSPCVAAGGVSPVPAQRQLDDGRCSFELHTLQAHATECTHARTLRVYKHTRFLSLPKHLCSNEVCKRFKSRGGAPSLPNRSSSEANGAS
jgi:hypothetical protein